MICDLIYAVFKCVPALLYKLVIETSKRTLLRNRRYNHPRVIERKGFIQPQEV
jgi:hypothetical protein